ncbi:MAG: ATP-dependent RecD-like DNA helicase [Candidatus Marinimicrobia bacterium]|nr:ATP-dependent RecD-like DNA helicase [Candidatus Neomarinimicrobiota bacterium]
MKIKAAIERFTYYNEENGYAVAQLSNGATAVGHLPGVNVGETVKLYGEWTSHPQYGRQFKIEKFETVYPGTITGIQKYLGSGLIKGIGPKMSERIVNKFKDKTLYVIENDVDRVAEVDGIGDKRIEMIRNGWEEQKEVKNIMIFLQSHEISTTFATKIYKTYQHDAIKIVKENPYQLTYDIWGIGFKTADKIAESLGITGDDYRRVRAGIIYGLNESSNNGHVYLPFEKLLKECKRLINVNIDKENTVFRDLIEKEDIIKEDSKIYLPSLYYAEQGVENRIKEHLKGSPDIKKNKIKQLQLNSDFYSEKQLSAIRKSIQEKIIILTGGPGTGKTTTLKGIIDIHQQLNHNIKLCAPTGRAAKRMSEVIGLEAKTIHRLLEYQPRNHTFKYNENNPLEADLLVIDEVSMIDIVLMNSVLKALSNKTILILVGDVDQLPSVGPGSVLRSLINSKQIPVIALQKIFRQAERSKIVTNAHKINKGYFPDIKNRANSDFFFLEEDDPEEVQKLILELVKTRLPDKYNYDPIRDIQVLTPMYRGETGASQLNELLQERLNPNRIELSRGGNKYKIGDKVMQLRNNYDKEIFNGDHGFITNIDEINQLVQIKFDDRIVDFDYPDLGELTLAYAISIHKSQGSEYPCVVMPITTQHYIMLQRNLLYTGITRAEELLIVIGSKKALAIATRNNKVNERYSSLFHND